MRRRPRPRTCLWEGGAETVGDQKIVFAWLIRGSNIVDYYDNIRFQVEGEEDFARLYDM